MNRPLARIAGFVAAGALLLTIAGPAAAADVAHVRVLHASPDAPAVDVYLDDVKVPALTDVPFGVISGYLAVPAGNHNVKVYATGTTTGPVIDANVTLTGGKRYTVAATGALAAITAQVIEDAPSPTCTTAQVRVVHFSADAPSVDVATAGSTAAEAVVKALSYPNASAYLALPGGSYDLEVRLAGTTTVALPLPGVKVADCTSYSVFAIGSAADPAVGGNGLRVVVAVDGKASAAAETPAATLPPTDAVSPLGTSTPSGFDPATLALIAGTAAIALIGALRLVSHRVRQD